MPGQPVVTRLGIAPRRYDEQPIYIRVHANPSASPRARVVRKTTWRRTVARSGATSMVHAQAPPSSIKRLWGCLARKMADACPDQRPGLTTNLTTTTSDLRLLQRHVTRPIPRSATLSDRSVVLYKRGSHKTSMKSPWGGTVTGWRRHRTGPRGDRHGTLGLRPFTWPLRGPSIWHRRDCLWPWTRLSGVG
jgi:hypothetical protein